MGEDEEVMRFLRKADPAPLSKLILREQSNGGPHRYAHKGEETLRKDSLAAADG